MSKNIKNGLTLHQRCNRISKMEFYRLGGFSNPNLYRITRNKTWIYLRER